MKKFNLLNNINRRHCGKVLLTGSLLLVAVGEIVELPSVQAVFFPGSYHSTELKLVRHECAMVDKHLISLQADVAALQGLTATSPSSSPPDPAVRTDPEPGWAATLHKAKKERVNVLQKLNYINARLSSMQGAISRQTAAAPEAVVDRYAHPAQALGKIDQIQARCRKYNKEVKELSAKITKLAGHCG